MSELVPSPTNRAPLTQRSFVSEILPPVLCYFVTTLLCLLPDTFPLRFGLLPITLWSAFRAVTTIDIALACDPEDVGFNYLNHALSVVMVVLSFRAIDFTFRRECLRRRKTSKPGENLEQRTTLSQLALDTCDLALNLRGNGWCWAKGLHVPDDTRPIASTSAFALYVFLSAVIHFVVFDCLHYSVQSFSPKTFGSPLGGSIFDQSLVPTHRYFRSTFISTLSGLTVYCAIHTLYDVATLIGVVVLCQTPSQWPPIFNSPWASTSLSEFWSKRWHQMFRSCFIALGAKPITFLVGPIGGVLAAFLISGILHDWGLWAMGKGTDFWGVSGFFLMMGIGVVMEGIYNKVSGQRVGGWVGRLWTMCWALGWANLIVDAWCRRGLVGSVFMASPFRPSTTIIRLMSRVLA